MPSTARFVACQPSLSETRLAQLVPELPAVNPSPRKTTCWVFVLVVVGVMLSVLYGRRQSRLEEIEATAG